MKTLRLRAWNANADNLDEMVAFYRNVLGAEEQMTHVVGGVNVSRLRLGASSLGFFDASEGPRPGVPHHTFEIEGPEDVATLTKELEGKGVKIDHVRPHGEAEGSGYSVYFSDPSGNFIELSRDPA